MIKNILNHVAELKYAYFKNILTAGDPPIEVPRTPFAVLSLSLKRRRENGQKLIDFFFDQGRFSNKFVEGHS